MGLAKLEVEDKSPTVDFAKQMDHNGFGSNGALQQPCDSAPPNAQPRFGARGRPTVIKRSALGKIFHALGLT